MTPSSEKVTFTGAAGATLAARLDLPAGRPRAFALFAHCFTCSKDTLASSRIAGALAGRGIGVLRFDFTGLGGSEGDFANTNFSSNVADLVAAARFLAGAHEAPRLLIGHSLGGAAVLAAAGRIPEARAVITINAPCDPEHVAQSFQAELGEIERTGEAEVRLAGRVFRIRKQFLDDIAGQRMSEAVAGLRKALLVLHAPRDDIVGIDNATRIFTAAKHPKSFVSLDDADHLLSRREDAEYVAEVAAAWASRYLGEGPPVGAAGPRAAEGRVVVEDSGEGKFTQWVAAGRHLMRADEPRSFGGNDLGPAPYDFLLAALGACTAMTLRMYAVRKSWPLEKVRVELRHEKIHAADCETCETVEGMVDRIWRDIRVDGPLDAGQRARLMEIADKCPVHRTLHAEIDVVTKEIAQPGTGAQ
ncbi:MAG: OsmC family protein [Proteobacteria bacterium]|nr:OsmC family protein [Pseudomonadota bacterium]